MKHSLLLLGAIAFLAIGVPAYSQSIYFDVHTVASPLGDGVCTSDDILNSGTTAVDVWLDTNHHHDSMGNLVLDTCVNATQPLDMFLYDVIIHSGGSGSVTFNGWTNAASGFGPLNPFTTAGDDMCVGYISGGASLSPGLYKLGTINVTVTGDPVLSFLTEPPTPSFPSPVTGFGSVCEGTIFGNVITLGHDFTEACSTTSGTPTLPTTWGAIKNLYR